MFCFTECKHLLVYSIRAKNIIETQLLTSEVFKFVHTTTKGCECLVSIFKNGSIDLFQIVARNNQFLSATPHSINYNESSSILDAQVVGHFLILFFADGIICWTSLDESFVSNKFFHIDGPVEQVLTGQNKNILAIVTKESCLQLWYFKPNLKEQSMVTIAHRFDQNIITGCFDLSSHRILVICELLFLNETRYVLEVYDTKTASIISDIDLVSAEKFHIVCDPFDHYCFYIFDTNGFVSLYDACSNQILKRLRISDGSKIVQWSFSRSGQAFLVFDDEFNLYSLSAFTNCNITPPPQFAACLIDTSQPSNSGLIPQYGQEVIYRYSENELYICKVIDIEYTSLHEVFTTLKFLATFGNPFSEVNDHIYFIRCPSSRLLTYLDYRKRLEVAFFDKSITPSTPPFDLDIVANLLKAYLENPRWEIFKYEVTDDNYCKAVHYQMNLGKIHNRIVSNFYTSLEAIKWDINMIYKNASRYNESHSTIVYEASNLTEELISSLDRLYDQELH